MKSMQMAAPQSGVRRPHLTGRLLEVAQLSHAQWLFGNVYEAVVKIPERLSAERSASVAVNGRRTTVLGPGSPVRYYAPAVPLTAATTLAALVTSGQSVKTKRWLAMAAGCWMSGVAITAYLVRKVNLKLFFADEQPPIAERDALIRTWYRLNVVRIATAAGALVATYRAKQASQGRI
jgi:hypothetical protein